jgi:hypothetical protein
MKVQESRLSVSDAAMLCLEGSSVKCSAVRLRLQVGGGAEETVVVFIRKMLCFTDP